MNILGLRFKCVGSKEAVGGATTTQCGSNRARALWFRAALVSSVFPRKMLTIQVILTADLKNRYWINISPSHGASIGLIIMFLAAASLLLAVLHVASQP